MTTNNERIIKMSLNSLYNINHTVDLLESIGINIEANRNSRNIGNDLYAVSSFSYVTIQSALNYMGDMEIIMNIIENILFNKEDYAPLDDKIDKCVEFLSKFENYAFNTYLEEPEWHIVEEGDLPNINELSTKKKYLIHLRNHPEDEIITHAEFVQHGSFYSFNLLHGEYGFIVDKFYNPTGYLYSEVDKWAEMRNEDNKEEK